MLNWNRPEITLPQDLAVLLAETLTLCDDPEPNEELKGLMGDDSEININNIPYIKNMELETAESGSVPEPDTTNTITIPTNGPVLKNREPSDLTEPPCSPEDITPKIKLSRRQEIPVMEPETAPGDETLTENPEPSSKPETSENPPRPHLPPNSPWAICAPPDKETRTDRFLFRLHVNPDRKWTITLINTDTAERKNHSSGIGGILFMDGQIYTGREFAELRGVL